MFCTSSGRVSSSSESFSTGSVGEEDVLAGTEGEGVVVEEEGRKEGREEEKGRREEVREEEEGARKEVEAWEEVEEERVARHLGAVENRRASMILEVFVLGGGERWERKGRREDESRSHFSKGRRELTSSFLPSFLTTSILEPTPSTSLSLFNALGTSSVYPRIFIPNSRLRRLTRAHSPLLG